MVSNQTDEPEIEPGTEPGTGEAGDDSPKGGGVSVRPSDRIRKRPSAYTRFVYSKPAKKIQHNGVVKRVVYYDSESEEELEKIEPSSIDPPMPSKSEKKWNGKRKRNNKQVGVAVPGKVSSSQSVMICVQGYKVKNINAPILKAIFRSHGDIAAECVFTDAAVRTSLLEAVCEIVGRIKTNDVTNFISKLEEIESQVSVAEVAKIDVTWLRAYLNTIHKMNEAQKKSTSLMEMKTNTTLVKMAAKTDVKEGYDEFVAARNRLVKAQRCVKVLELVEKKLNDNLLESKAEKDSWPRQPVILDNRSC